MSESESRCRSEWVLDELFCFLGTPFFQSPIQTWTDEKCMIFEPGIDDSEEHRKIFEEYKAIVDALLSGFCDDEGLTQSEIVRAVQKISTKKDLGDIFEYIFDPILATDDYVVFAKWMIKKNLEIQKQALMLILKRTGAIPDAFQPGSHAGSGIGGTTTQEQEVINKVIENEEKEAKKSKTDSLYPVAELKKTAEFDKIEMAKLKIEEEKVQKQMVRLAVKDVPPQPVPSVTEEKLPSLPGVRPAEAQSKSQPAETQPKSQSAPAAQPVKAQPTPAAQSKPVVHPPPQKTISNADAAASWLASAKAESETEKTTLQAHVDAMSKLSADELQRRQEFLKQQRDKLIAMKKNEREKHLLSAEKAAPSRPKSARAARSALSMKKEDAKAGPNAEEQKQLEMRRAIANRLKQEVVAMNDGQF